MYKNNTLFYSNLLKLHHILIFHKTICIEVEETALIAAQIVKFRI